MPTAQVLPEHSMPDSKFEKEIEDMRMGPAKYDPEFKLTEKRADIGVVKIKEPIHEAKEKEIEGH